jgi:hypothetical protein
MPVPGAPSTVPGQDAAAEGEFGPDAVKGDDDETKTAPGKNDVKGKKVKKTEGAVIRASHFPAVSSIEGRKRLYLAEKSMLDGVEGFEEVPEGFADILLEKAQKVFDALPETIADRAILQFHDAVSFTSKGGSNVSLDSDDPNVVRAVALIERMGGR